MIGRHDPRCVHCISNPRNRLKKLKAHKETLLKEIERKIDQVLIIDDEIFDQEARNG